MVRSIPTTPVKVTGAMNGCPSSVIPRPEGWVASVMVAVRVAVWVGVDVLVEV